MCEVGNVQVFLELLDDMNIESFSNSPRKSWVLFEFSRVIMNTKCENSTKTRFSNSCMNFKNMEQGR